jgi:hypothetical protein
MSDKKEKIKLDGKFWTVIEKNKTIVQMFNSKTGHKENMLKSKFDANYEIVKPEPKK